jgi:hypothetical protein
MENFGDAIQNLKVDSVPNSSQQSSLQTLHNILETIKPSSEEKSIEQFTLTPGTSQKQPQVQQKKPTPVVTNKTLLLKKTGIITALFILLNTEVFRKLIIRFSDNTMIQTVIISVIFAALTMLIIKFYN